MERFVYHRIGLLLMSLLPCLLDNIVAEAELHKRARRISGPRNFPEIRESSDIVHYDSNRFRTVKSGLNKRNAYNNVRPLQEPYRASKSNNNSNVVAQTGTMAVLNCYIGMDDVTVIWVKTYPNSTHVWILTVNDTTMTDDKRFSAKLVEKDKNWTLRIKYTRTSDQGTYECQVCNHPTFSIYVNLGLVEAFAEILDDEKTVKVGNMMNKTIDKGSPIRLSCILHKSIKEPEYIFWYFKGKVINYELKDTASVREGRLGSELIFRRAEEENEGTYTCIPSNARPASINVIVNYYKEPPPKSQPNKATSVSCMNLLCELSFAVSFTYASIIL